MSRAAPPPVPGRVPIGAGLLLALLVAIPSKLLADRCAALCVQRLAGVLGADVRIGTVRMSPFGLTLSQIRSSTATIERAVVAIDPLALLTGRVTLGSVTLEEARAVGTPAPLGAASVRLARARRGWHGVVRDATYVGLIEAHVAELSFDLNSGGRPERIAFLGARVQHPVLGSLRELQGQLRGAWPDLKGRLAAPGIEVQVEASADEQKITAQLDRYPLLLPFGGEWILQPPVLSGTVELLRGEEGVVQLVLGLRLGGMILKHRLLSAHAVGPIDLEIGGDLGLRRSATGKELELATNALVLRHGGITLAWKGRASATEAHFEVRLPTTACATLLESVPQGFLARLAGLPLAGNVGGRFALDGAWASMGESGVALDLDFRCKTSSEAPLGDPTKLGALGTPIPDGVVDPALRPARFAPLSVVPAAVIRALLESEDSRFFLHPGFDVPLLRRALAYDLTERRLVRGASTLSQQLVKNLYLSGERTLERKVEEAFLTWRLEATTKKERILELYLNLVDFGAGGRGIAGASRHWFDKPTSELTLDEAAELVSLLPAPSRGKDEKWRERLSSLRGRLGLGKAPN